MKIDKECKECGTPFVAIKTTQYFCSRKCFRKDYQKRKREEEANRKFKFPAYSCGKCHKRSLLDFNPLENMDKFDAYECPYCGCSNRTAWINRKNLPEPTVNTIGAYSSTTLTSGLQVPHEQDTNDYDEYDTLELSDDILI